MQRDVLELLKRIANALALQFGTNCEVVIHDLTGDDPENTIACIENGHEKKCPMVSSNHSKATAEVGNSEDNKEVLNRSI